MSSLNNSSIFHKPCLELRIRDNNVQAMQDALPGIDNKVDLVYILLPNSELGKCYKLYSSYSTSPILAKVLSRSASPVLRNATRLFLTAASKARN